MKNKKIEVNRITAILALTITFLIPLLGLLWTIFIYCADLQNKINELNANLTIKETEIKNLSNYYDVIIRLLSKGEINIDSIKSLLPKEEFEKVKNTVIISSTIKLPFLIEGTYQPSGWMGDLNDIKIEISSSDNPKIGDTCIKIIYNANKSQNKGWAGIYWQYPDKNWGDNPRGLNLKEAGKVSFWARGLKGGEKAEFKIGGIEGNYPDSIFPAVTSGIIILNKEWKEYTIDLSDQDLTHVIGGFCWATTIDQNPNGCTIYLDDIKFN